MYNFFYERSQMVSKRIDGCLATLVTVFQKYYYQRKKLRYEKRSIDSCFS